MNKLWYFPVLIVMCVICIYIASLFIPRSFQCIPAETAVWSHRGVHTNAPENSPEAVRIAIDQGFTGVELDVFYDEGKGLVVSHDQPYKKVNGQLVLLKDMLSQFGTQLDYWIDLKNLDRKNRASIEEALLSMTEDNEELRAGLFIESSKGKDLKYLSKSFNCIYWVQFSRSIPKQWLKLLRLKALLAKSQFAGITTDDRYLDTTFQSNFNSWCWYVFTVNSPERLEELSKMRQVQVILTDLESPYGNDPVE